MKKMAFLFPGQGAQYTGMAKEFYETFSVSRQVFEEAFKATGLDVEALCFREEEKIHQTEYTQIGMLTAETAILKAVEAQGVKPAVCAGLSLGEYGALIAAGVMREQDAFSIVRKRGIYMQEAVPEGGAMTAVMGLDGNVVEEICGETAGQVSVANYNCPGQIVITGEKEAVDRAAEQLKEAGARRVVPLKVSGPFHSPMLKAAGEKLAKELEQAELQELKIPYVTNVTAEYVTSSDEVKELLTRQIASPVRWQQSIERMLADGVDIFVEIGPGRTLSGFVKKIDRTAAAWNIDTMADFEAVMSELKGAGV